MIGGYGRTLVLDPGVTTGWAVYDFPEADILQHVAHGMQSGGVLGVKDIWPQLRAEFGFTRVCSESFVLDGRTAFPDLTPKEMEGALKILWDGHLILQRNTFKRFGPDDLLEELGWFWPGKGHDRDAARHALALAQTCNHRPTVDFVTERDRRLHR